MTISLFSSCELIALLAALLLGGCARHHNISANQDVPTAAGAGDIASDPPRVRQQIHKTAPPVVDQSVLPVDTTPQTIKFSARRATLGSLVVALRKQGNATKAVAVLAAGGVTAQEDGAIRKLGDVVDGISSRAELSKWESAFGVKRPRGAKVPPDVIEKTQSPVPRIVSPPPPIPKLKPAEIPNKIDPL